MPAFFLFSLTKISHIRYGLSQKYKKEEGKTLEEKYKINLHILEACNFRCRHCFSKFGTKETLPVEDWKKIVDNCIAGADVDEFNIAGGEPMLYPGLTELVKYIRNKGVKVSLITNGSLMDEEWIKNYAGLYETIGFSVDSLNDETNKKIGRCNRNGKAIPADRIVELCGLIRKYAPVCRIKINTVVSALNKDEVMSDFIDKIAADRWKILRMKPFQYGNFSNLDIQVSDEEFERFVERNKEKNREKNKKENRKQKGKEVRKEVRAAVKEVTETAKREVVVEPDMKASYVLIDSNGCLLDNAVDEMTPVVVCDCLREDFAEGLRRLTLDREKYEARYN